MKNKLLLILFISVYLTIGFVSATITTFNDSLTEQNMTFSGNSNVTKYLNLTKTSTILSGTTLNLKSFLSSGSYPTNAYLEIGTPDGIYEWNLTGTLSPAFAVNNIRYWDFDEGTGTISEDIANKGFANQTNGTITNPTKILHSPGILGNAVNFSTRLPYEGINISSESSYDTIFNGNNAFSISVWVNSKASNCNDASGDAVLSKGRNTPNGFIAIKYNDDGVSCTPELEIEGTNGNRYRVETDNNHWEAQTWQHWIITYNGTINEVSSTKIYINGTSVPVTQTQGDVSATMLNNDAVVLGVSGTSSAEANQWLGLIDEMGIWDRVLNSSEIEDLYNGGNAKSFTDNFFGSYSIPDFSNAVNIAVNNGTCDCVGCSVDALSCSVPFQFHSDTDGKLEYSSLLLNDTILPSFKVISQTFNNPVLEGNIETFSVNITYNPVLFPNTQGVLVWNGTRLTGTKTGTGENITYSKSFQIPNVGSQVNVSFYWELNFINATDNFLNSSTNNQTIENINIDDCSVYTTLILNYTMYDEESRALLNGVTANTSMDIDLDIFQTGSTDPILEFSQFYNQTNPAKICIDNDLNNSNYTMDVQTKYSSTDRAVEYHHIQEFALSNSTIPQHIQLYDLLLTDSQEFLVLFKDDNFIPLEGALINVKRQYIPYGEFRSVEIAKTDSNGKAIIHLVVSDIVYSILVTKNGETLATFDNVIAVCEDIATGDCQLNLNQISSGIAVTDYDSYKNVNYIMSFDEASRTMSLIYNTIDGSSAFVELNVTKFDSYFNQSVCFDSLTSSAGSLSCVVPESFGNATIISEFYVGGDLIVQNVYIIKEDLGKIFEGVRGFLVLILLMATILMFAGSPVGLVVGALLGFIMVSILLLTSGGSFISSTSAVVWLIIAGGIIIWKLNNRKG